MLPTRRGRGSSVELQLGLEPSLAGAGEVVEHEDVPEEIGFAPQGPCLIPILLLICLIPTKIGRIMSARTAPRRRLASKAPAQQRGSR